MLDEFTSVGKLEIFERALAFMAGYGLKAFLIIQDLTQLQGTYGRENSVMGNCHVRVAYTPNTVETAKVLSEMCGKTTVVQAKRSRSRGVFQIFGGNVTEDIKDAPRDLMTPDEIMQLRAPKKNADETKIVAAGDMLTFVAGHRPILGRQPLFFFDKVLLARSEMPPAGCPETTPDDFPAPGLEPAPEPNPFAARIRAAANTGN
jgi:type IV secretion system protein VirD4